jgi:hypothetical protein
MILRKKNLIPILITFYLIAVYGSCNAAKGYIITPDQDTIIGKIDASSLESYFSVVSFKGDSEKSYKRYSPTMISGFGFKAGSTTYIFRSVPLNYKSLMENKDQGYRFINLIHRGRFDLYRNIISVNSPVTSPAFAFRDQEMQFYEYYICSDHTGLLWVGAKEEYKTLRELLQLCRIEPEYINNLPKRADFKDIWNVLSNYDKWLSEKKSSILSIKK